jgi:hypothetical protein
MRNKFLSYLAVAALVVFTASAAFAQATFTPKGGAGATLGYTQKSGKDFFAAWGATEKATSGVSFYNNWGLKFGGEVKAGELTAVGLLQIRNWDGADNIMGEESWVSYDFGAVTATYVLKNDGTMTYYSTDIPEQTEEVTLSILIQKWAYLLVLCLGMEQIRLEITLK